MTTPRWAGPTLGFFLLLGAAAVGVLFLRSCDAEDDGPAITGPVTVVPDTVLLPGRPMPGPIRWRDRLVEGTVAGGVAVSEGTPDTSYVRRFTAAAAEAEAYRDTLRAMRARGDTNPPPRKPKAILPTVTVKYDGRWARVWATRSDGSLLLDTARIRPTWRVEMGYDRGTDTLPRFVADRWFVRLGRDAWRCKWKVTGSSGLGALADTDQPLRGAMLAGGAALVGCLL
jgi:hypothetical protein